MPHPVRVAPDVRVPIQTDNIPLVFESPEVSMGAYLKSLLLYNGVVSFRNEMFGSDVLVGVPEGALSEEAKRSVLRSARAAYPGLKIDMCYVGRNDPEALSRIMSFRRAKHGILLDITTIDGATDAALGYLKRVDAERFARQYPEIVLLNESAITEQSVKDLREIIEKIAAALPDASPMTLEALAASLAEVRTNLGARTAMVQKTMGHTASGALKDFIADNRQAVSITTQGILASEMMFALRDKIQARWSTMGISSREKDPIRELVVITDPNMTRPQAEKYLDIMGLTGYVQLVMADELTSVVAGLQAAGVTQIGIRSRKDEKDHIKDYAILGGAKDIAVKLELGAIDGTYLDTNSYEVLLELFAQEGEWKNIPGVSKVGGIYIYIPKAVPFNYDVEIRLHQEAMRVMMSSA